MWDGQWRERKSVHRLLKNSQKFITCYCPTQKHLQLSSFAAIPLIPLSPPVSFFQTHPLIWPTRFMMVPSASILVGACAAAAMAWDSRFSTAWRILSEPEGLG